MRVPERPRDDDGRLGGDAYADAAFVAAVQDHELPTTGDVAAAVGCHRTTAHARLQALERDGKVQSQRVGSALVWRA